MYPLKTSENVWFSNIFRGGCKKSISLKWPNESSSVFQILTELEYSGVGQNKEQSATMFAHLVSNASQLIKPYIDTILKVYIYLVNKEKRKRNSNFSSFQVMINQSK